MTSGSEVSWARVSQLHECRHSMPETPHPSGTSAHQQAWPARRCELTNFAKARETTPSRDVFDLHRPTIPSPQDLLHRLRCKLPSPRGSDGTTSNR